MNFGQVLLIFLVRIYRWLFSPLKFFFFGARASCRFSPTCSAYALEAVALHGALRGSVLSVQRLCRCHPWGGCGCDPVPARTIALASDVAPPLVSNNGTAH